MEIAQLVKGEIVSVRTLSEAVERKATRAAGAAVFGATSLLALAVGLAFGGAGRVLHAPSFLALWGGLALALAVVAGGRARARSRRYAIGVDIDDDAFAPLEHVLVRRGQAGYELALAPGMSGVFEGASRAQGRAHGIEGLVREGATSVRLEAGARAEVTMATTTFVVRARADRGEVAPLPRGFWRPFVRRALLPMQLATLVVFMRAVPAGALLAEADMKSAIPANATPWEVEKLLRQEAQLQARTLHACFDPLPLTCQHPGYVGVGLSLARDGEIRSSWISRSTYGKECPVDDCMTKVISGWYFEPLPEAMRIVLPVQVLRTDKPLPAHASLLPSELP